MDLSLRHERDIDNERQTDRAGWAEPAGRGQGSLDRGMEAGAGGGDPGDGEVGIAGSGGLPDGDFARAAAARGALNRRRNPARGSGHARCG